MNEDLKRDVEGVLTQLGLTTTDAITLLFHQIRLTGGIPFDVKVPNALTAKTLSDSTKGKGVAQFNSVDELFDDLEGNSDDN